MLIDKVGFIEGLKRYSDSLPFSLTYLLTHESTGLIGKHEIYLILIIIFAGKEKLPVWRSAWTSLDC